MSSNIKNLKPSFGDASESKAHPTTAQYSHFHTSPPPKHAELAVDFLIVGGGIAGLACAIALRRVGHRVTVLERDAEILDSKSTPNSGGCRMAPNLSKILYHWGLKDALAEITFKSEAIDLLLYETGEVLGTHVWDEEMLRETRGEFIFAHYADLRHLLYTTALSLGAKICLDAQVTSLDPDTPSVTLATGKVVSCHVLVCADGVEGLGRKSLDDRKPKPADLVMYSTTIPRKEIAKDEELNYLYGHKKRAMFGWFGNTRSALGFPLGGEEDFSLFVYGPAEGQTPGSWTDHGSSNLEGMQRILESAEPRLQKLGKLATPPTCVPVLDYPPLEDWVHDSGCMVVIGEAAHPLPPGAIQTLAISLEDGAVLAKLFSHLLSHDQTASFLYAFDDLRRNRCNNVHTKEKGDIGFMCCPPGPFQEGRDAIFRAKRDRGLSPLAAVDIGKFDKGELEEEDETPQWREIKEVFGYDAEDEADNWWQEWGLLRERARGREVRCGVLEKMVVQQSMMQASTKRSTASHRHGRFH